MSAKRKSYYGWYVVIINAAIGCILSAGFPQSSMTAAALAASMGVTQEAVLVGDTIKTVGIVLSMMLSGAAYQKMGLKKVFLLSMALVVFPLAVTPFVKSLPLLYLLKLMQGFSSLVFPLFLVVIIDWVDEQHHGLSTAIYTGVFYGGAGIGGTFSGFVIEALGWQASFYVLALLQAAASLVWLLTVREKEKPEVQEISQGVGSFTGLLRKPIVWLLALAFIATTWSVQAISVDLSLFGTFLGYNDVETGTLMSAITIGIISASIVSGKLSDLLAVRSRNRAAARIYTLAIGCVIVIGSVMALLTADLTRFAVFYVLALLFSFGASWGLGSFYCILPEVFEEGTIPVATGFIGGCGDIGMTLGPVGVGILCGVRGYWGLGWSLCAVIAAASLLACFILIQMTKRKKGCF